MLHCLSTDSIVGAASRGDTELLSFSLLLGKQLKAKNVMAIVENYIDAALRHWLDAELLKKETRMENADQLYGISAECAIKSALAQLPIFTVNSRLDEPYRKHINVLWNHINLQSLQKAQPCLETLLAMNNPFEDWSVDQRYHADGYLSERDMEKHRNAVRRIFGALGLSGVRR